LKRILQTDIYGEMMEEENTSRLEESQDAVSDNEEIKDDSDALKKALLEEKAKAEDYLAKWQRAQADFINYKRRSDREKEEIGEYTKSTLIRNILPALDDFERAISAIPEKEADTGWVKGIKLIERKLRTILELEGLSTIEVLGEMFDPNLHEAVRQKNGKDGLVIEEARKGYRFHDRILRPSQVVVGNGEEEEVKE
jgi:molecular chaperone GrpE